MKQSQSQRGFTTVELVIVLVVMGLLSAIALPRIHAALQKTYVRSARVAFGALAVKARAAAIQRGCVARLNFTTGSGGTVWVTACKLAVTGTDTLGPVDPLATRYSVSLSSTSSSVSYDPRGVSVGYTPATVVFTSTSSGDQDSSMINRLGKVVR